MKFAVANQFFMIAHEAGVDYTQHPPRDPPRLPASRRPAEPRLRGRPVPLQGHDAARRVHDRPLPDGPVGDAGERGPAGLHRVGALDRRYGGLPGKTIGILGMAFKAESDDPRASLSYKLRKLLAWAGARVLCTDPYVHDERFMTLRLRPRGERRARPRRAAQGLSRPQVGGRDVVDIWGALGEGIRL